MSENLLSDQTAASKTPIPQKLSANGTGRTTGKKRSRIHQEDQPRILDLIRKIKDKTITGKMLCPIDRQTCLMYLLMEGSSVAEAAHVLQVSERTIERDKKAIRARNALVCNKNMTAEFAGELFQQCEISNIKLRRTANSKDARARDRIEAERAIWQIRLEFVKALHSLGYLQAPDKPSSVLSL